MDKKYSCDKCDLKYQTLCGLKKHVKSKHQNTETKQYKCKYCDASFGYRQSKWLHEQKCKTINQIPLAEEVKNLKAEIKELKAKPSSIINNTTNNTTNNIQIVMKQPGTESIEHLTTEKQRDIMQKGLNSLTYLIEKTNFNKNVPENHTYCVASARRIRSFGTMTALNDKHASVINSETNTITKIDKNTLFDKVLISSLSNLEKMAKNPNFKPEERKTYEEKIKNLKDFLFRNRKSMKRYYQELNLLSYNNKDMVMETWASLKTLKDIIEPENTINNTLEFNDSNKKIQIVPDMYLDDSGSELSSDSDDSDDSDTEEVEFADITIKNITYIIEGNKLYQKTESGKGGYYGTYSNGKVKKAKKVEKHIDL